MAHHGDLRVGRSDDRRHEHVRDEIDVGEPTLQRADEDAGQGNQPLRDAAFVHQLTDEHEEGNGEQAVFFQSSVKLLGEGLEEQGIAAPADIDGGGQGQDERDRHTGQKQQEEGGGNHLGNLRLV